MRFARPLRLMLLALAISIIPASSYAGVFISVNFGPPVLPVYVQPPCPQPGLMWTPGYWAYGPDGYYWVPGAWVPAPYVGALWTPGYWGWGGGLYVFHPGYWGRHVGYYGGVNYGFGYMGIGFAGGEWRGREFAYNTDVVRVDRTVIHNTYIDHTVVVRNTIVNDRHVAYSGGPGGINHPMSAQERTFNNEPHVAATSFQTQHEHAAQTDRTAYFNNNHGRPANVAVSRPLQAENHPAPQTRAMGNQNAHNPGTERHGDVANKPAPGMPAGHSTSQQQYHPESQSHPSAQYHPAPQSRPAPQSHPQPRPQPQERQRPEGHGNGR